MARKRRPRLMTRLDRYLILQMSLIVLFGLLLFSIIWLAPDVLFRLIQHVFSGKLTVLEALELLVLHLPAVLQQTIPMAVLLGAIFLFQRLSHSYELIVMQASGISSRRILQAVLWVGVLFAGLHYAVQEAVIPWSSPRLEARYIEKGLQGVPDRNFVFVEKNHRDQLDKFFTIAQVRADSMRDFIVLYYQPTAEGGIGISRILRADTGRWNAEAEHWQLNNGIEYVLSEDGVYRDIRQFKTQFVRTDKYAAKLLDYSMANPMSLSWNRLRIYINLLKEGGQLQDVPFFTVRLFQKMVAPLAVVVFALLGALMGMEKVRSNRSYGLTFGALVVFLYSVLVPFASNLGSLGVLPPWLVAWLPLLLTALVGWGVLKIRDQLH